MRQGFDRFVGIPYVDRGRDFNGCDCWGLVALAMRELRGIELPSYAESYRSREDLVAIRKLVAGELWEWREISRSDAATFDVVLMPGNRFAWHLGIIAGPGLVLHVHDGVGTSCIERMGSPMLREKLIGFYRHGSQAGH